MASFQAIHFDSQSNTYTSAAQAFQSGQWLSTTASAGALTVTGTFTSTGGSVCPSMVAAAIEVTNLSGAVDTYWGDTLPFATGTFGPTLTTGVAHDLLIGIVNNNITTPSTVVSTSPALHHRPERLQL